MTFALSSLIGVEILPGELAEGPESAPSSGQIGEREVLPFAHLIEGGRLGGLQEREPTAVISGLPGYRDLRVGAEAESERQVVGASGGDGFH
jgi:hypothetical protein